DQSGGDVISVTVAGEPKVSTGRAVTVTGLVALPWSQDGRSGIAYRAAAIPHRGQGELGKNCHVPFTEHQTRHRITTIQRRLDRRTDTRTDLGHAQGGRLPAVDG